MFGTRSFEGLLKVLWANALSQLPKIATLFLLLRACVGIGDQIGVVLVDSALVSIAIILLALVSSILLSLSAVLLPFVGFVLVGLFVLGFIRLGVLGDDVHELTHVSDCSLMRPSLCASGSNLQFFSSTNTAV